MHSTFEPYKRALAGLGPILYRHVFLLVNFIIFAVVGLLYAFGDTQAALFIGIIIVINMCMGITQDFKARVDLEKLQLLTALRVIRIKQDGAEELIFAEQVAKGDHIRLSLGDQVPCDGTLIDSKNLEVSEALLTGESDSFPKDAGAKLLAGGIVTAGSGVVLVETIFAESRISQMTAAAKKYSVRPSPIQQAVALMIRYSGYVLLLVIGFVLIRGYFVHAPYVEMVNNIGALASIIVPQGLVVITTLLFAFGAASYSTKHVLFQEINATEKLGRIKNLCMDKTGTLTDNALVVESMELPNGISDSEVKRCMAAYIAGSGDSSQTIVAVGKYINGASTGEIVESLPFSSWRRYGAVRVREKGSDTAVFVGAPDVFLPYLADAEQEAWLRGLIDLHSIDGKRVLAIARADDGALLHGLPDAKLSIAGIFVFKSTLREGITDAISFFQNRGVHIRILSGDNIETARTVAKNAGVADTDKGITGVEMDGWSDEDFKTKAAEYTIFARILPEQKVKIIDALKLNGFTAMVGDGANDALAIKRADLGIAMFDGAPATRQLASVVLMNNSFTALPGGVSLADNFIHNIEIFASLFINQSFLGLFVFTLVAAVGYPFPLTPLNITFINYFTVGLPGMLISYWAIRPSGNILPASTGSFLKRVAILPLYLSIIQAIGILIIFLTGPAYLRDASSNTLVLFAFIAFGLVFFAIASRVHDCAQAGAHRMHIVYLCLTQCAIIAVLLNIPFVIRFFTITMPFPDLMSIFLPIGIVTVLGVVQYTIAKRFSTQQ